MLSKYSVLKTYDIETGEVKILHHYDHIIEAPNWLPDGDTMLYNCKGHIVRYSISRDEETILDTDSCTDCNNDHVPSPDGKRLGVSNNYTENGQWGCRIWTLPLTGGKANLITENSASFLHGWSKDGELCYCAFRGAMEGPARKVDIYVIPQDGGEEKCLTDGKGYNDGPEYSPDDKTIWFNSTRNGLMQAFRMNRDGSELTQMTHDPERNCWFPHVSPDQKKVVYITFKKGDLKPEEHLPDKNVELWLMDYDGSNARKLLDLYGGQGTINVNSWAPDSRHFAFVSYEV